MLLDEDGIYETLAALLCLAAAGVVFKAFRLSGDYAEEGGKRWVLLVLACAFLFMFLEEISWGQRIFAIPTPEFLRSVNLQQETNLHNLKPLRASSNLLTGAILLFFVLVPPMARMFPWIARTAARFGLPVPGLRFTLLGLTVAVCNRINYFIVYKGIPQNDRLSIGEAYESGIELLLFLFALEILRRARKGRKNGPRVTPAHPL